MIFLGGFLRRSYHPPASARAAWYAAMTATWSRPLRDIVSRCRGGRQRTVRYLLERVGRRWRRGRGRGRRVVDVELGRRWSWKTLSRSRAVGGLCGSWSGVGCRASSWAVDVADHLLGRRALAEDGRHGPLRLRIRSRLRT